MILPGTLQSVTTYPVLARVAQCETVFPLMTQEWVAPVAQSSAST